MATDGLDDPLKLAFRYTYRYDSGRTSVQNADLSHEMDYNGVRESMRQQRSVDHLRKVTRGEVNGSGQS